MLLNMFLAIFLNNITTNLEEQDNDKEIAHEEEDDDIQIIEEELEYIREKIK